jgi:phosphoribosyl 1,2-cyclic phosphodiesterase
MWVRFWGTRGSLPVAQKAMTVRDKIARALVAADGRRFADVAEATRFAETELDFATGGTFGGATTCVEMESGDGSFLVCDMGSGLREFGLDAMKRCAAGHKRTYNIFMSHLHWDHIMGFPFFAPAFDPEATIVIHSGHKDAEQALRRQQEEISFPVPFDWLRASISFRHLVPSERYEIAGAAIDVVAQHHSYGSFGYRFTRSGKSAVFSTDSEHKIDDVDAEREVINFFRGADLAICDTMYSLADAVTMKEDWGHSSNIVAVDLCHAAAVRRLALFHHEPTYGDEKLQELHAETIRYEELTRTGTPLEISCAYDGLEVRL